MVIANPIPRITHCQYEQLHPIQGHGYVLGRVAAVEYAAFPESLAIARHLELDTALLADFIINAHAGGEALPLAAEREAEDAVGVRPESVLEPFAANGQRVPVHRLIGLRLAKLLFEVLKLKGLETKGLGFCDLQ